MTSPASFDFLRLNDAQRLAVYHHLGFWAKRELRRVAKGADCARSDVRIIDYTFCPNALLIAVANPAKHLGMEYKDDTGAPASPAKNQYNTTTMITSQAAQLDFLNRLTAAMPPCEVNFVCNPCHIVDSGCIRYKLDICRWPINALHQCLARDAPLIVKLREARKTTSRHNSAVEIYLPDTPKTGGPTDPACFQQIFEQYPPINNAPRLTLIDFNITFYYGDQLDHELPEQLRAFLTTQLGPDDSVELLYHTDMIKGSENAGRHRMDFWLLVLAQNGARWTDEVLERKRFPIRFGLNWVREWSAKGARRE
ncbi:unnamed protein product, partial [Mesorhabditis spiculigera]